MSGRSLFPPDPVDSIRAGRREGIRHVLDAAAWQRLSDELAARPGAVSLLALWAEAGGLVHALFQPSRARPLIATVAVEAGRYLALSGAVPDAVPYERIVRDLFGFEAMHARDLRPLLDHGAWPATAPMRERPGPPARGPEPPEWLAVEHEDLSLVETGPVGMGEGLLRMRLALDGPVVARAEFAHGYNHRGLLAALAGAEIGPACAIAERVSAGSGVAHATAFARAVEQASGTEIGPEVEAVRALAGEAARIAASLALLAAMAREAGALLLANETSFLLADWREAQLAAFGHRFARGFIRPGGAGVEGAQAGAIGQPAAAVAASLPGLERAYARGLAGRLRGQARDDAGICADARMRARLTAIGEAAGAIAARVSSLPVGVRATPLGRERGEGLGHAPAPEGEAWHFVRLDAEGRIACAYLRDPSVPAAARAEAALAGTHAEDADLLRLSFGLSPEGFDL